MYNLEKVKAISVIYSFKNIRLPVLFLIFSPIYLSPCNFFFSISLQYVFLIKFYLFFIFIFRVSFFSIKRDT